MITTIFQRLSAVAFFFSLMIGQAGAADALCTGKFPNLITDVCWSCTFPMKMFGGTTLQGSDQEDVDTSTHRATCVCGDPPKVGVPVSFWEMARMVDVTSVPYCLPLLGGAKLNGSYKDLSYGADEPKHEEHSSSTRGTFRHVNYYINPVMYILGVMLDNSCIENKGIDVAYMSSVDPSHTDEELANILAPYAFPFGGIVASAACAADCVAATANFPISEMFWCAGCNGNVFPLTGYVPYAVGQEQVARLMVQRILAKMHASGTQWSAFGENGMCNYYPQIIMDKKQYKVQRLYYIPQTKKIAGRCCDPLGRTTVLSGIGTEIPILQARDSGYAIFRKRDCCQGVVTASSFQ